MLSFRLIAGICVSVVARADSIQLLPDDDDNDDDDNDDDGGNNEPEKTRDATRICRFDRRRSTYRANNSTDYRRRDTRDFVKSFDQISNCVGLILLILSRNNARHCSLFSSLCAQWNRSVSIRYYYYSSTFSIKFFHDSIFS